MVNQKTFTVIDYPKGAPGSAGDACIVVDFTDPAGDPQTGGHSGGEYFYPNADQDAATRVRLLSEQLRSAGYVDVSADHPRNHMGFGGLVQPPSDWGPAE